MEGEGEKNETESTLLQNDPDWYVRHALQVGYRPPSGRSIQDPLRALIKPTRIDDTRPEFYKMYQREATIYDTAYVKNKSDDLNTMLVFVSSPYNVFLQRPSLASRTLRPVCSSPLVRPS